MPLGRLIARKLTYRHAYKEALSEQERHAGNVGRPFHHGLGSLSDPIFYLLFSSVLLWIHHFKIINFSVVIFLWVFNSSEITFTKESKEQ